MASKSTTKGKNVTAREYLRVSDDRSHRGRSVDEQHTDNERAVEANGWSLGQPYEDNDRSASRYATKAREGYDRLIGDLRADRFKADVLVLWESSRGSRKVSEWVVLLELLEAREVKIHVTSHGRTYDPANHRDRRSLLEDSVDSEYESGKTSDRVRRATKAAADEGRPGGRCPWGYRRIYDERTRELVRQEPDPETAPLVRELFEKVHAGHSIRSIARDWEARGIVKPSGRPFTASHLRAMLTYRAYTGQRVHNPGDGRVNGNRRNTEPARVIEGIWEPLVNRVTFEEVQTIIAAPERYTVKPRPGRASHLLSFIAVCDVCGGPMVGRSSPREEYGCRVGHVKVNKAQLDEVAEAVILAYLNNDDLRRARAAAEDTSEALSVARAQVAVIKRELDDLYAKAEAGTVSPVIATKAETGMLDRLKAAEAEVQALAKPSDLDRLFPSGTDWQTMPMSAKREVARRLLTIPDEVRFDEEKKERRAPKDVAIGQLRVTRAGPKRRVPAADRIRWNPPLTVVA